ncbi:FecR family protein [Flavitalea flava]
MDGKTPRLSYLLDRYLSKTCTEAEKQELAYIALDSKHNEEINILLEDYYHSLLPSDDLSDQKSLSMLSSILDSSQPLETRGTETAAKQRQLFAWKFLAIAASVILILITGGYFIFFKKTIEGRIKEDFANVQDVKAPEINKAMIVLDNGQKVALDSMQRSTLSLQGNVIVTRSKDGQVSYKGNSDKLVYNTLVNPRGSKVVHLTLQDGTRVWLDCESSLKYPISFGDKDRNVEVKGEAYFEVAKNPFQKFTVLAGGVKTEVIGTHFNVDAYNKAGHVNVTLLEGSVKISNSASSSVLKPGQQAQLTAASDINIEQDIDAGEIVAWKDGVFNFNSLSLHSIMDQIERWYDVQVVYDGVNTEKHFSGIFSRTDNVSEILKMIELAGVKFEIEGKKIIVKK